MYKIRMVLLVMMIATIGVVQAQETEITDDELKRYAIVMDSIDVLKSNVKEVISEMVSSNEDMSGARYNELSKIIDNEDKLKEANATGEEVSFIKSVKAKGDELTQEINSTFQSLAIDYIGDGGRIYKKVKAALKSDESIKERYSAIEASLKNSDNSVGASEGSN